MDARYGQKQTGEVDLSEGVREAAAMILRLMDQAGPASEASTTLRAACEEASARMNGARLTVAFVGDAGAGRRTLYNALLGDRVLTTGTPRRGTTVTVVRRAPLGFVAQSLEGRCVANLARKLPDRDALFSRSLEQMHREIAARQALTSRLQAARAQADALRTSIAIRADLGASVGTAQARKHERASLPGSPWAPPSWWRALWLWMHRLWIRLMGRARLPPGPTSNLLPPPAAGTPSSRVPASAEQADCPPDDEKSALNARLQQEADAISRLERELGDMATNEQIEARIERLRLEQKTYDGERRTAFLAMVRQVRGTDVAERIIEYPAERLAPNLTLVDLPSPSAVNASAVGQVWSRVAREADALVLVADIQRPLGSATAALVREWKETAPLALVVLTKADGVATDGASANGDLMARISQARLGALRGVAVRLGLEAEHLPCIVTAAEAALDVENRSPPLRAMTERLAGWLVDARPTILAWREAARLRGCASELARARATEEDACRKKLAALESKLIPDPGEFRGRVLERVEGAIAKGADDVLAEARRHVHEEFEALRMEWHNRISACVGRSQVEACAKAINESAQRRIVDALERTAEHVARELQELSETLERWALDEIHSQYQLVRRLGVEILSPVASELTRDDLAQEPRVVQIADGALDAFEKQRVHYGLGGIAAGAVLGTLIAPGIGTAVGAMLGVFAGLLKGVDSLKEEYTGKVLAFLDDAEKHAHAQLVNKRAEFSRVVRITLDEALEGALGRLSDAIGRLMAIEREVIDRERNKLESLRSARLALETCDRQLANLMATTSWQALSQEDAR